jgi:hypothetical protein
MEELIVIFADDEGHEIEMPVPVSRVGPNLYRVEEHPDFLSDIMDFGDVIEVERCTDGLRFVRVVEKSQFKCFEFTIGPGTVRSAPMQRIFRKVEALGGRWDFLINFLYVYVPPESDYDPTAEIELVRANRTRRARERDEDPTAR